MNYELAKQLKDAGFPQRLAIGDKYSLDDARIPKQSFVVENLSEDAKTWADARTKIPTLEELIEACGSGLYILQRNTNGTWRCVGAIAAGPQSDFPTPDEAVAHLYLALRPNQ
jgi:hypothetical protein